MKCTGTTAGYGAIKDPTFAEELEKYGIEKTLNRLFNQYWKPLFQFCFNLLQDEEDAKDTVQEVFIRLWDRNLDLAIHTSIESYLFTSVRYRSLSKLSQRLSAGERNLPLENHIEQSFLDAVDPIIIKELQMEIDAQIDRLPERMREVIRLKSKDSLSIAEIARRLNISENTVKNHLASARKRLRVQLGDIAYLVFVIGLTATSH